MNNQGKVATIIGFEAVPVRIDGNEVTKQSEGPDEHTSGWAVYCIKGNGEAVWVRDFVTSDFQADEVAATKYAEIMAFDFNVKVIEPTYKTNPDSEYNRRRRMLAALPDGPVEVTSSL